MSFNLLPQHPRSRTSVIRTEQIALPGQAGGTIGPESSPGTLRSPRPEPAPATFLESCRGYQKTSRLVRCPAPRTCEGDGMKTKPQPTERACRRQGRTARRPHQQDPPNPREDAPHGWPCRLRCRTLIAGRMDRRLFPGHVVGGDWHLTGCDPDQPDDALMEAIGEVGQLLAHEGSGWHELIAESRRLRPLSSIVSVSSCQSECASPSNTCQLSNTAPDLHPAPKM
jgi:hypothetical protein